jgi:hypothetical protein
VGSGVVGNFIFVWSPLGPGSDWGVHHTWGEGVDHTGSTGAPHGTAWGARGANHCAGTGTAMMGGEKKRRAERV